MQEISKADLNVVLHKLKEIEELSILQISRLIREGFNIVKGLTDTTKTSPCV